MLTKNNKKIKYIVFDLGGVVMHGGYLPFIKHYCMECLTHLGRKRVLQLERQVNLGEITEREFYQQLHKVLGVQKTPKQMHDLIVKKMRVDKGLLKLFPKFKLNKQRTALFTNSIGMMAVEVFRLRHLPIKKLFNKVFISSSLHIVKPDASAYRFVLKKLKAKASQTLMVDDRLENVTAARKLGMVGIVYKNAKQFSRDLRKMKIL